MDGFWNLRVRFFDSFILWKEQKESANHTIHSRKQKKRERKKRKGKRHIWVSPFNNHNDKSNYLYIKKKASSSSQRSINKVISWFGLLLLWWVLVKAQMGINGEENSKIKTNLTLFLCSAFKTLLFFHLFIFLLLMRFSHPLKSKKKKIK